MYNNYRRSNNFALKYVIYLVAIFAIFIAVLVMIYGFREKKATARINNKVESIGGTVIDINMKGIFSSTPFIMVKGDTAYEFTYSVNGETKVGWYKLGLRKKWILDYQKDK